MFDVTEWDSQFGRQSRRINDAIVFLPRVTRIIESVVLVVTASTLVVTTAL